MKNPFKKPVDQKSVPKKGETMDAYMSFCYRLVGRRFERKPDDALGERLRRASLPMTPGLYKSVMVITILILVLSTLVFSIIFFLIIFNLSNWYLFTIILVGISAIAGYLYLPMVTRMRISNRKSRIDHELPFSLSELSILASTGLPPIEILKRMSRRCEDEYMASEFKKVVFKTDVEGKDIISALGETARETPSELFRETLWDLANMIHQGGNLDQYLRMKADDVMSRKRAIQKEFVERLMGISEMFVSLVLISVLFIGIAAFLLDAMSTSSEGLTAELLLILLGFVVVPVASFAFIMIVTSAYSKTE